MWCVMSLVDGLQLQYSNLHHYSYSVPQLIKCHSVTWLSSQFIIVLVVDVV